MRALGADEDFDALVTDTAQLVAYVSRPSCGVCVALKPKIEGLLAQYGVPGVYVDAEAHPAVAGQRVVFTVPTVLVFDEGREVGRFSRHMSLSDVERLLSLMAAPA